MMIQNMWFFAALACAILWGLSYTLTQKVLDSGVPVSIVMVFTGTVFLILSIILSFSMGELKAGLIEIARNKHNLILLITTSIIYVAGSYLIYFAIHEKNATLASLIEISYPFFVCLFSYIIFKDIQINFWTAIGGIMIFFGVCMIYLKGSA